MAGRQGRSAAALLQAAVRRGGVEECLSGARSLRLERCAGGRGGGLPWTAAHLPARHTPSCSFLAHRRLSSGAAEGDGAPKRQPPSPVDTTTPLDTHLGGRQVERRIEEHLRELRRREQEPGGAAPAAGTSATGGEPGDAAAATDASSQEAPRDAQPTAVAEGASHAPAHAQAQREALRLVDPNAAPEEAKGGKEVIVRSSNTTGQVLWPATQEDIEILSQSKLLYPAPYEVEGSVIIRLVRLSDPVTSPVARVVRNRQFGIRGNEKWQLLAMGIIFTGMIYSLGFWQLRRMEWKRDLIEMRRTRLAMPKLSVQRSPFPWNDAVQDYVYRMVDVRGVFDHRREMLIGPRPGTDDSGATVSGFLVVTPLRLEDGSTVLVNRGHVPAERMDQATRPELPTWVRIRGILEEGEVPNMVGEYARLKNRPDRNLFIYLVADELAENSGARNHEECKQALITATDVLFEDDFKAGMRRELPFTMRHKEDYLLFWADEHTHFNYACQWFGMGTLILSMTIYKFIEVVRWRY